MSSSPAERGPECQINEFVYPRNVGCDKLQQHPLLFPSVLRRDTVYGGDRTASEVGSLLQH
jgi:hypothetical protein